MESIDTDRTPEAVEPMKPDLPEQITPEPAVEQGPMVEPDVPDQAPETVIEQGPVVEPSIPEQTPAVAEKPNRIRVKAPVALIRQGPSTGAKILSFEKKGKEFEVPGEPIDGWFPVSLSTGKNGWVISDNVDVLK